MNIIREAWDVYAGMSRMRGIDLSRSNAAHVGGFVLMLLAFSPLIVAAVVMFGGGYALLWLVGRPFVRLLRQEPK